MNGADILPKAAEHIGETYIFGARAPLENRSWRGPWDCAEYASWLTYQTYGILYGCGTVTDPSEAEPYTGSWAADANNRGVKISVSQAVATPGAFLLRLPIQSGPNKRIGHIGISIGDGTIYEAAGAGIGVRIGPISGRRWDTGVCLPGVLYTSGGASPAPRGRRPLIVRRTEPPIFDDHVVEVQSKLKQAGFDPGRIDGMFGSATEKAVVAFQLSAGLPPDGEVGPLTGNALGLPYWPTTNLPPQGGGIAPAAGNPPLSPAAAPVPSDAFGAIVNRSTSFADIESEYASLFSACVVRDRNGEVAELARRIGVNRQRYMDLVAGLSEQANSEMPWFFVALIHAMEASGDVGRFKTHLHNGDPLSRPTVHVPKGRPDPNRVNFQWEESARDALSYDHFDTETDWSLPRMLFRLERYNGMGPRKRGHASAYLWSYSNHYLKGKYVSDGVWDSNAVSRQPGCAVILKELVLTGVVEL